MQHDPLSGENVVAVLHYERLFVVGKRPAIAEIHLAAAGPHPRFEDQFALIPAGETADGVSVHRGVPLFSGGAASESGAVVGAVLSEGEKVGLQ